MTPFVVEDGDISEKHVEAFRHMQRLVFSLPDSIIEPKISCHHLCHALSRVFRCKVVDGHFGSTPSHSWLVLEQNAQGERVIADMYPFMGATPFLVFTGQRSPWNMLYKEQRGVLDCAKARDPHFEEHVSEIAAHFNRAQSFVA